MLQYENSHKYVKPGKKKLCDHMTYCQDNTSCATLLSRYHFITTMCQYPCIGILKDKLHKISGQLSEVHKTNEEILSKPFILHGQAFSSRKVKSQKYHTLDTKTTQNM